MNKENSQISGLLDLPNETLIYIFEFLTFEEVAKFRIVCKRIDEICQKILNSGFQRAAQLHAITYKRIKALLPRRESERRNHSLARHADILTSVETRISMLSMTYTKYMDLNMCCFIPGRVLDEIFRILRLTTHTSIPLRPLEILQEFRDISSMAIEHFDEKIASEFKKTIERNALAKSHGGEVGSNNCMHRRSFSTPENLPGIIIGEPERGELLLVRKCVTPHILKHTSLQSAENAKSHLQYEEYDTILQNSSRMQRKVTIRNLQNSILTLRRKSVQQKKHLSFFLRKVNCLTSQMAVLKRRLDELDSKNQELIGTIRQYSLEDSQAETTQTTATSEIATVSTDLSLDEDKRVQTSREDKIHITAMESEKKLQAFPTSESKLARKALKRHLDEVLSCSEENEKITELSSKRRKSKK